MDELDAALAERLRATLDERGMRREDLARAMVELGFRWTGNTVTQVVTGRRGLSLLELSGVCATLGLSIEKLLDYKAHITLPSGDDLLIAHVLLGLVRGTRENWAKVLTAKADADLWVAERMEAMSKAAQRLGVDLGDLILASRKLWGDSFPAERDRRVNAEGLDVDTPEVRRALQARRGHVSRALIQELRTFFAEQQA